MHTTFRLNPLPLLLLVALGSACMGPEYPDDFDESTQPTVLADAGFGTIPTPVVDAGVSLGDAAVAPQGSLAGGGLPEAGGVVQPMPSSNDAGGGGGIVPRDASTPRDSGSSPEASAPVEAGTSPEAGTSNDAGGSPGGTVSSCTITASTDASTAVRYRGKYGCAVWIANSSNKVVKAFLVATIISGRSGVPTYRSQASGVSVDVTTSATLNAARQHMYTWNASSAAPGKYSLNVETHSENGVKLVTVPFDISNGPVSAMGTANVDIRSAAIDCK